MRKLHFWILAATIICVLYSCRKEDEKISFKKEEIKGFVQKGPFINGTSVQMYELNDSLEQTGKSFNTQVIDNRGTFSINNIGLSSQYVELLANGYYFNEFTGSVSSSPLSLYALSDLKNHNSVNVNLLTHLERNRAKFLIGKGMEFTAAKDTAQKEILKIFGFLDQTVNCSEELDISESSDQNAMLLAVSLILQGDRSAGDLSQFLADLSTDLQKDGKITDLNKLNALRSSATHLNAEDIMSKLLKRYQEQGVTASIPNFSKYLNSFLSFTALAPTVSNFIISNLNTSIATLSASVNANDLITTVSFEYGPTIEYGNTSPATPSSVAGHSPITVTSVLTLLNPATFYHCRLVATNSKGTAYSNDLTFTTLGGIPIINNPVALNVSTSSATLACTVNGNKLETNIVSELGTDTNYGKSLAGDPSTVTEISNILTKLENLLPATTYHYRFKASNSLGIVFTKDETFTTLGGIPIIINPVIRSITSSSAMLTCDVNGNKLLTTIILELGTSNSYGQIIIPIPDSTVTETGYITVYLTNLLPATTYHYRVKATNSLATVYTDDKTFTTLGL